MFYILARELDSGNCLPTEQEVLGSISGSAVELFCKGQIFHGTCGLGVSVCQYFLSIFCPVLFSEETHALC